MAQAFFEVVFTNKDFPVITVTCRHGGNTENFSLNRGEGTTVSPTSSLRYAWRKDGNAITAQQLSKFGANIGSSSILVFGNPAGKVTD